jgi:hypothetical protein
MKYFFFLLSLLLPLYSLGITSDFVNQHCFSLHPEKSLYLNVHFHVDDHFSKNFNNHSDCDISSRSIPEEFVPFPNSHERNLLIVHTDFQNISNLITSISPSYRLINSHYSAIPVLLMKESFLV